MLDMIEYQKPVAKRKSLACFELFPPGTRPSGLGVGQRVQWAEGLNKCDSSQRTRKTDSTPGSARSLCLDALKSSARFLGKVPQVADRDLDGDGCGEWVVKRGWGGGLPKEAGRQIFCIKREIYILRTNYALNATAGLRNFRVQSDCLSACLAGVLNLPIPLSLSLSLSLSLCVSLFLLPRAHAFILGDNCRPLSARMIKASQCFQINFIVSPRCLPPV